MVRTDSATAVVVVVALLTVLAPIVGATVPVGAASSQQSATATTDATTATATAVGSADGDSATPDRRGVVSGRTNLSDADTRVGGEGDGDRLGRSVARVGDVNGDGDADLLVGAPRNDSGGENAGAVYLFYGPVDRGDVEADDADAVFYGVDARDRAGSSLAGGDVDGDGYSDLVIGVPGDDAAANNSGATYVIYGGPSLSGERSVAAAADVRLEGVSANDRAGNAVGVVRAGDLDDPDDDDAGGAVLVGARAADTTAGNSSGAVYVVDLRDGFAGTRSLADADSTFLGEDDNDAAGLAVAGVGDVDDDGREEVAVGSPGADDDRANATNEGAVYVLSDVFSGGTRSLDTADARLDGADPRERAGSALAGGADVNGDGVDDLVIGAPFADVSGQNAGAAYVVFGGDLDSGSLADADRRLYGAGAGDLAGYALATVGARCGDVADVLVGAPRADSVAGNDSGAVYLIDGEVRRGATNLDDADATLYGESPGDEAGWSVAGVGDVGGDDADDVVVGAPRADPGGAAYVVHGDCVDEQTEKDDDRDRDKDRDKDRDRDRDKDRDEDEDEDLRRVSIEVRCTADGGRLVLENPNDEAVRVVVTGPDGYERRTTLDAEGDDDTLRLSGLDNGEYTVRTRTTGDDSKSVGRETVTIDCEEPDDGEPLPDLVETNVTCTDDGATLRLANPNDDAVRVVVDGPNDFERNVSLDPAGEENDTRELTGLENGSYTVRTLTDDGDDSREVGRERLTVDCPPVDGDEPDVELVETNVTCEDDGGVLVATNQNDVAVQVDVEGPGDTERRVTLQPGDELRLDGLQNGTYTVRTLTAEDENVRVVGSDPVEVECERDVDDPGDGDAEEVLPVETAVTCAEDGGVLVATNPNDVAVQVDVEGPGDTERRVTLQPGDDLQLDKLQNGTYTVRTLTANDEGVTEVSSEDVVVACAVSGDGEGDENGENGEGDENGENGEDEENGEEGEDGEEGEEGEGGENGEDGEDGEGDENGEEGENGENGEGEEDGENDENGENGEDDDGSENGEEGEDGEDGEDNEDEENDGEQQSGEDDEEDDEAQLIVP